MGGNRIPGRRDARRRLEDPPGAGELALSAAKGVLPAEPLFQTAETRRPPVNARIPYEWPSRQARIGQPVPSRNSSVSQSALKAVSQVLQMRKRSHTGE